jgi:putative transcriptional regulator
LIHVPRRKRLGYGKTKLPMFPAQNLVNYAGQHLGHSEMTKKLTGRALARFEAGRDIWQEVLDGVREIKAGRGRRFEVEPRSPIVRARLKSGLTQAQFAALLGVSKRTLEQWEQGRRTPSGAARMLIRLAELHPEVLREIAA